MDLEEKGAGLNRQIELRCGFGELRRSLDDFEEAKKWKVIEEIDRQEVEDQLPTIQEENGNGTGAVFSEQEASGGDQSPNPTQHETNGENLGIVESGGGDITIAEEMDGLVGGERTEYREEQAQFFWKKEEEE